MSVCLHKSPSHSAVIITRTDLSPSQSYLIRLSEKQGGDSLRTMARTSFFCFPDRRCEPTVLHFQQRLGFARGRLSESSTLKVTAESVEFYTMQGKKITASW